MNTPANSLAPMLEAIGRLDDEGYGDGLLVLQNGALQGLVMVDHCGPDHIILRTETKRDAHHITRDQLYRLAAGIFTVLAHVDHPGQK